jgi:hypothetical protein
MTNPQRDAELVARLRSGYEAFNRGHYDEVVEVLRADDRFEFHRVGGFGVIRGREALREWMEPDAIQGMTVEPLEIRVNGDKVLVRANTRGRGGASGIELEVEAFTVWTLSDDGVFIRAENFVPGEEAQALRAAGFDDPD